MFLISKHREGDREGKDVGGGGGKTSEEEEEEESRTVKGTERYREREGDSESI